MSENTFLNDSFATELFAQVPDNPVFPQAYYNRDGDCIELLLAKESYKAERLDDVLTVYIGRDCGEPIGVLIKNVHRFVEQLKDTNPGVSVDLSGANCSLEYLLTAYIWNRGKTIDQSLKIIIELRDAAAKADVSVQFVSA